MSTLDMTRSDLDNLLQSDGVDTTSAQLFTLNQPHHPIVQNDFAEQGDAFVPDLGNNLPTAVLVNGAINGSDTVNTDLDLSLKGIATLSSDNLTVTGTNASHSVFVTTDASSGASVTLADTGNDTVILNGGGDSAFGGAGRDTIIDHGTGGSQLISGVGDGTMIDASSGGGDFLVARGAHQILAGEANDTLVAFESSYDALLGGSSLSDRAGSLHNFMSSNVAGASFTVQGGADTVLATGGNQSITDNGNGAGSTLIVTGANAQINITGTANDTIIGAADHSTLLTSADVSTDVVSQVLGANGVTTMTLGDGQVLKLANITNITFSDGVTLAVDPPTGANPYADVVADAQAHVNHAHVAAIEAGHHFA